MEENEKKIQDILEEKLKNYPLTLERNLINIDQSNDDETFRVMQWNMLARGLCFREEYSKAPPQAYDWNNYRKWRTIQELTRYKSDIICLEEADFYEEIKPFLHDIGYTSVFCPKYSSPCLDFETNFGPDGCAIFYRISKFQINNMSCEKIMIDDEICPQIYIIIQLKHKKNKKLITLVCLHLKSKEENHKRRENQMKEILKGIKIHLSGRNKSLLNNNNLPILLCGDFNGENFENFYKLIVSDNELPNLVDAYTFDNGKKEPTTIKLKFSDLQKRGIDYIFYNKTAIKLISYLELPKNDILLEEQGLPNMKYSSDHLSLICDFIFI